MSDKSGPVLIELDTAPGIGPAEAPPVAETAEPGQAAAMQKVAVLAARRP